MEGVDITLTTVSALGVVVGMGELCTDEVIVGAFSGFTPQLTGDGLSDVCDDGQRATDDGSRCRYGRG